MKMGINKMLPFLFLMAILFFANQVVSAQDSVGDRLKAANTQIDDAAVLAKTDANSASDMLDAVGFDLASLTGDISDGVYNGRRLSGEEYKQYMAKLEELESKLTKTQATVFSDAANAPKSRGGIDGNNNSRATSIDLVPVRKAQARIKTIDSYLNRADDMVNRGQLVYADKLVSQAESLVPERNNYVDATGSSNRRAITPIVINQDRRLDRIKVMQAKKRTSSRGATRDRDRDGGDLDLDLGGDGFEYEINLQPSYVGDGVVDLDAIREQLKKKGYTEEEADAIIKESLVTTGEGGDDRVEGMEKEVDPKSRGGVPPVKKEVENPPADKCDDACNIVDAVKKDIEYAQVVALKDQDDDLAVKIYKNSIDMLNQVESDLHAAKKGKGNFSGKVHPDRLQFFLDQVDETRDKVKSNFKYNTVVKAKGKVGGEVIGKPGKEAPMSRGGNPYASLGGKPSYNSVAGGAINMVDLINQMKKKGIPPSDAVTIINNATTASGTGTGDDAVTPPKKGDLNNDIMIPKAEDKVAPAKKKKGN